MRVQVVPCDNDARTESTTTNGHNDAVKVGSAENFFAQCGIASSDAIVIVCLGLKCVGLRCQELCDTLCATDLVYIYQVCAATIRLHCRNFYSSRGCGHDHSA